ncbi:MAG TPA: type IV pilin protein [Noviherbaspirillum sp.]|uniref:type IV pilin protein n=1 Tax=Noviherbaspirillum sp. TaxID=1926288 RepID=UPI002B466CDE|nr:type IV pilin protein [Noviherbaspirillum sp.]HJV85912.1 type IV pilin protein [Noviherbaspirillum sp.]
MNNLTSTAPVIKPQPSKGFTLIELMIAVVIIGIIAAIAYPSYTRNVIKSNRSAAESYMLSLANKEEQFLLDSRQYSATVSDLLTVPADVGRNYTVTITTTSAPPSYTITATPTGNQLSADTACGTLTLAQDGTKGVSGTAGVTGCW